MKPDAVLDKKINKSYKRKAAKFVTKMHANVLLQKYFLSVLF